MDKPVLSIGIIFRDDIRCIERCLKALQPLRDAVPCELVMADTGSKDGSREAVEKYADILFDFPWINDFAAARNAVLDRCSGEWFLSVDTDEYLDENITELTLFLKAEHPPAKMCRVNIRNYRTYEMDGSYSDFYTVRLINRAIGARYQGAIHEAWTGLEHAGPILQFVNTIFHHDGYVNMGQNKEKLDRNVSLLRKKLKAEPQNLLIRLQLIESGFQEADYLDQIRRAVLLTKRKPTNWQFFGPPIVRLAVSAAKAQKLPEFEKWTKMAEEWFPNSYYTRIDVEGQNILESFDRADYEDCIRRGEPLLEAYADYRAGRGDMNCNASSTLQLAAPYHEVLFHILLSNAYLETGQPEKSLTLLEGLDYTLMDGMLSNNLAKLVRQLHSRSRLDTAPLINSIWKGITTPKPSEKRADERRMTFLLLSSATFSIGCIQEERAKNQRLSYTAFIPLAGKCDLGTAAAIMASEDLEEINGLLKNVENWSELPYPALGHAIKRGAVFPLPDKPLKVEELDNIASRFTGEPETLRTLLEIYSQKDSEGSWQFLCWSRALVLAAARACHWKEVEKDLKIARAFAKTEGDFIANCYTSEILCEENLFVLPPMHRFGWYCSQAFDALDAGDSVECVRLLRAGLSSCPTMKPMVEFLLDHTPELQTPPPSPELLELAEKVKAMLAAYPADDPAVAALKESPAYQRVAHLIEEP